MRLLSLSLSLSLFLLLAPVLHALTLSVQPSGSKDTAALQAALDQCASQGGGEVLVTPGNYLTGSLELKSNTTLRLAKGAVLNGSSDLADYPLARVRWEGRWVQGHRGLLYAHKAARIAVVGEGKLVLPSSLGGREMPRRPALIEPVDCQNITLEGFSAEYHRMWGVHPTLCDDVVVRGLTIRATGGNSDGIDVDSCRRVLIERCDIDSGDDCVALKSGRGMEGFTEARPTTDVLIRDCVFADRLYACIGIGSEASGGIRNVRIERCRFVFARTHAIYIKSRPGRGAYIENISAEDLDVETAPNGFLRINLLRSGIQDPEPVQGYAGIPHGGKLHFKNIRVNCGVLVEATEIVPEKPVDGLILENLRGTCAKGMSFANIRGLVLKDINVGGHTGPLVTKENVQESSE